MRPPGARSLRLAVQARSLRWLLGPLCEAASEKAWLWWREGRPARQADASPGCLRAACWLATSPLSTQNPTQAHTCGHSNQQYRSTQSNATPKQMHAILALPIRLLYILLAFHALCTPACLLIACWACAAPPVQRCNCLCFHGSQRRTAAEVAHAGVARAAKAQARKMGW